MREYFYNNKFDLPKNGRVREDLGELSLGAVDIEKELILPIESDGGVFEFQEEKDVETLIYLMKEE